MLRLLTLAMLSGLSAAACAAPLQNAQSLHAAVDAFVRAQAAGLPGRIDIQQAPIDPRLKLARCEKLETFLPPGGKLWGNSAVGVRCPRPVQWSIYVPVQVRVWADVVISARPIARGQPIAEQDISLQNMDLTQLPRGVYVDPAEVVGKVAKTNLGGAMPIRPDMLKAPVVITHGQSVRLLYSSGGLQVSSEGRALGNAGVGEAVQVRAASGKVIKGIVHAPGVVQVQ